MAVGAVDNKAYVPPKPTEGGNYKERTGDGYDKGGNGQGSSTPNDFGPNQTGVKHEQEGNRHDEATKAQSDKKSTDDTKEADNQKNAEAKQKLDEEKETNRHEESIAKEKNRAEEAKIKEADHHEEADKQMDMQYKNTKGHQKFG